MKKKIFIVMLIPCLLVAKSAESSRAQSRKTTSDLTKQELAALTEQQNSKKESLRKQRAAQSAQALKNKEERKAKRDAKHDNAQRESRATRNLSLKEKREYKRGTQEEQDAERKRVSKKNKKHDINKKIEDLEYANGQLRIDIQEIEEKQEAKKARALHYGNTYHASPTSIDALRYKIEENQEKIKKLNKKLAQQYQRIDAGIKPLSQQQINKNERMAELASQGKKTRAYHYGNLQQEIEKARTQQNN